MPEPPEGTKWIIVTGGVLSGLGKGVASASLAKLLTNEKCMPIKCDGYLNVDPGTMNPMEHGEVFVLDDGGEVDMDFGHYERFLGLTCKSSWNLTMGRVFKKLIDKERNGDFLGSTVQFIPHMTNTIKKWWFDEAEEEDADVVIVEIGGTVGDIENELYIEAARQLKFDVGVENIFYTHLTYVPIPETIDEQKSKPTQQSVSLLNSRGISPDLIIARCKEYLTEKIRKKIAIFSDLDRDRVITGVDVDSIYKIPEVFEKQGVKEIIRGELDINDFSEDKEWKRLTESIENSEDELTIAMCGKYTELEDSYASIVEALIHSGAHEEVEVNLKWIETSESSKIKEEVLQSDGVIVPGGFGSRGTEGKVEAIRHCRENNVPFAGLCYGLQLAVVEFARNVCGLGGANTSEVDEEAEDLVVDILPEQEEVTEKGGTMRLGAYPAVLKEDSLAESLYGEKEISERHRHRYEVNPEYHEVLQENGLVFSGMSPSGELVEFIELEDHPFFIATQAHPEFKSSLKNPAPVFHGLVKAAMKRSNKK